MASLNIQFFTAQDLAALMQLLHAADLPVADLTPASLAGFLVARSDTDILGAAGVEAYGEIGLLRSVVVTAAQRGTGLGKRLVAAMETRARKQGIRHLYLLTTTAERFFSGLGYRQLTRDVAPEAIRATTQFSKLCPILSIFMMKELI